MTGVAKVDTNLANKAAGFSETPTGMVWHHDPTDPTNMMLVPQDIHSATGHTGGAAFIRATVAVAATIAADIADATPTDVINFVADNSTLGQLRDVLTIKDAGGALYGPGTAYRNAAAYDAANSYSFSSMAGSDPVGAAGGFLLYPNKPNNSQIQNVYRK